MTETITQGNRYRRFRDALDHAGLTLMGWAEGQNVSRQHVYAVISGTRESQKLLDAVDGFIGQMERSMDAGHPRAA